MKRVSNHLAVGVIVAGLAMTWAVSPALALPPDPDNAALLYYQAFLTIADLGQEARDHIAEVARGNAVPNEKTREYISKCGGAIGFAEAAGPLQVCHWGFRYSQGFEALMPQLAQARFLAHVLLADARIRASDGNYKGALERCLLTGALARHVGDDTLISYLVSMAVSRLEYDCIRSVVGQAAGDAELLRWLRRELAASQGRTLSPIESLKVEREIALDLMQMSKLDKFAKVLTDPAQKDLAKLVASADEQTLERARRIYSECLTSVLTTLSSPRPYAEAYPQLDRLVSGLDAKDPATAVARALAPAMTKVLGAKTTTEAYDNAVKAAVEICLQQVSTGRLPDALPAGTPKDPFSGLDFQYERTAKGFVLRCQGKDLAKNAAQEFAFTVK